MVTASTNTLASLARKINSLNATVIEQMVQSGKLLLEAQTKLKQENSGKRGGFQDWIRANLKITPQTATRYMRLARSRNPTKVYSAQKKMQKATARKSTAKTKAMIARVKGEENVVAPNWNGMSPINRAKAAFNALEPSDRQDFLKWVADQFDNSERAAQPTTSKRRTAAEAVAVA